MVSNTPNSGQQTPEDEVEKLAQDIGRLIRAVEPQMREDLKELAYTLIREEMNQGPVEVGVTEGSPVGPFNPFGVGVLILVLGAGLSFIFGPVGLVLMLGGLIFIMWGVLISWFKR